MWNREPANPLLPPPAFEIACGQVGRPKLATGSALQRSSSGRSATFPARRQGSAADNASTRVHEPTLLEWPAVAQSARWSAACPDAVLRFSNPPPPPPHSFSKIPRWAFPSPWPLVSESRIRNSPGEKRLSSMLHLL